MEHDHFQTLDYRAFFLHCNTKTNLTITNLGVIPIQLNPDLCVFTHLCPVACLGEQALGSQEVNYLQPMTCPYSHCIYVAGLVKSQVNCDIEDVEDGSSDRSRFVLVNI